MSHVVRHCTPWPIVFGASWVLLYLCGNYVDMSTTEYIRNWNLSNWRYHNALCNGAEYVSSGIDNKIVNFVVGRLPPVTLARMHYVYIFVMSDHALYKRDNSIFRSPPRPSGWTPWWIIPHVYCITEELFLINMHFIVAPLIEQIEHMLG